MKTKISLLLTLAMALPIIANAQSDATKAETEEWIKGNLNGQTWSERKEEIVGEKKNWNYNVVYTDKISDVVFDNCVLRFRVTTEFYESRSRESYYEGNIYGIEVLI